MLSVSNKHYDKTFTAVVIKLSELTSNGSGIMSPGGSTLQCRAGRDLLCGLYQLFMIMILARLERVDNNRSEAGMR